ncbi:MAG: arylsulfatase A-like enzyme [Kiritimatiellia bacterium]
MSPLLLQAGPRAATDRPNILLLFADDLGYGELGCQGNPEIPTPHIDSIAQNGVRFTQGYVTAPVCAPSRAGLLSGRNQRRFGWDINVMPHVEGGSEHGIPATETTLAEYLKALGYRTGIIGKWHLGARRDFNPLNHGFDSFFGFAHEGHYFVPPPYAGVSTLLRKKPLPDGHTGRWSSPERPLIYHDILGNEPLYDLHNPILRGFDPVDEPRYLTDAFTDEGVAFLRAHQDQPFFLFMSYNAVHSPLQGADAYMKKMEAIPDIHRRIFAAMLANLDDSIGTLLATLRTLELERNTWVIFLSDNGGPTRELTSSNLPLKDGKGRLAEGGIRIPFMMQWPGQLPAGMVYEPPVISLDIYATAGALAGKPVDPKWADGVDLMPYLRGDRTGAPHEQLWWEYRKGGALREGPWKIVREPRAKKWALYNLDDDIGEETNLAAAQPERLARMQAAWEATQQDVNVSVR